jgi:glycosyltransferase involved in cell wall biosynthesis
VTFAAAGGDAAAADDLAVLRRSGIEVAGPPRYPSATQYLEQHGAGLDLVHLHRHTNAALFLDRVRELAPLAKVVFSPHDLHYLREQREAEVSGRAPSPGLTREQELHCVRRSDATIVFSDVEAGLLQQEVPTARLRLLRWIAHPYPSSRGFAGRDGICFVGGFRHSPNTDGLQWFVAEVLPLVLRELPDLRLHVAGSDPPESVRALASANVLILGWVPDLEELFGRMRLSVAPLRFGAGFKGKVATSLAHGLPVVGTAVALEGTGLAPGEGVAVADDPASFARAVVRLHGDEAAWTTLAASGLQRCRELYSPAAALGIYRQLLADLGLPVAAE